MPLVIYDLGGGHTLTQGRHTHTHTYFGGMKRFQETRCTPACSQRAPGLKTETAMMVVCLLLLKTLFTLSDKC